MLNDTCAETIRETYDLTSSGVVNHERFNRQEWSGSGAMAGSTVDWHLTHKCAGQFRAKGTLITIQSTTVTSGDSQGGYSCNETLELDGQDLLLKIYGGKRFVRLSQR